LTNDPAACANCHIMREQFDGWIKSSHRSVAVCNDCHTPHDLIPKYVTKASNGYHHSRGFTTGDFHEPIQITARNREITENACRYCHEDLVLAIEGPGATARGAHARAQRIACIRCHASVGHLE